MAPNPRNDRLLTALLENERDTKRSVLTFLKNAIAAYEKALNERVNAALSRVKNGINGRDGRDGKDGKDGKDGEDGLPGRDGKDLEPQTADQLLAKLRSIKLPWLTKDDKDELLLEIAKAKQEGKSVSVGAAGGGRGFFVYIDGVKKGIIKELNFVAGTAMAIAYSQVNGRPTLTFNASGGTGDGITVETPVGTVDASNASFTVSAEPKYVVSDGTTYFDGAGYTYAALTITMDIPPSASIRAII